MRIPLAALLASAALLLPGCVEFLAPPQVSQLDVIGDVEFTIDLCASDDDNNNNSDCTENGDANDNDAQLLISFLLPENVTAPDSLTGTAGAATMAFTASPGFVSALESGLMELPAQPGERWVGYVSEPFAYTEMGPVQTMRLKVRLRLPRAADGGPFPGPLRYAAFTGARMNNTTTLPSSRPVVCDTGTAERTLCVDDFVPATLEGNVTSRVEFPTRDLGVLAGNAAAVAGSTAQVPFTLVYAGSATPDANFSIEGATSVPGAGATPSQASLLPASDSSTPVNVAVNVPAGTRPGVYDVTLTAKLPNGQIRSNTAKLTVTAAPKDTTGPTPGLSLVRGQDIASVLKSGLKVRVKMDEAGSDSLALTAGSSLLARNVTISKKTVRFTRAGTKTVRLKLNRRARSRAARRSLLSRRKISLRLRTTATDLAGNVRRGSKAFSIRR